MQSSSGLEAERVQSFIYKKRKENSQNHKNIINAHWALGFSHKVKVTLILEQQVALAASMFTGLADIWWKTVKAEYRTVANAED